MTATRKSRAQLIADNIVNGNLSNARAMLSVCTKLEVLEVIAELATGERSIDQSFERVRALLVRR